MASFNVWCGWCGAGSRAELAGGGGEIIVGRSLNKLSESRVALCAGKGDQVITATVVTMARDDGKSATAAAAAGMVCLQSGARRTCYERDESLLRYIAKLSE